MDRESALKQSNGKEELTRAILRRLIQVVVQFLILVAILFISAGRLDWMAAWACIGVGIGILAINGLVVLPRNPEMIAERGQVKEGAKGWDKLLGVLIGVPTLVALIGAGLDQRFGWSPPLAVAIHLVGLALVALGQGLFSWAMASNKFFSTVVRIQMERGHTVATGGPYRYVRHPGYVGMIITMLATPLALGSLWALIPEGIGALGLLVRTALEDRTLLEELDGYRDYAARVRYRLLPGVW
jgi:protein-S-isoprenylcysteine O-methyltransferase Ste14